MTKKPLLMRLELREIIKNKFNGSVLDMCKHFNINVTYFNNVLNYNAILSQDISDLIRKELSPKKKAPKKIKVSS